MDVIVDKPVGLISR